MKHSADAPRETWQESGFALYVHWPFCAAKCPYCDFNSHVVQSVNQAAWREALVSEIARYAEMAPGRNLSSIYFGGGTPSLMPPDTVDAVIAAARKHWGFTNSIEITLEANPSSVELGKFQAFSDAGVDRVSLGFQALNDTDLRRLGRLHNTEDIYRAWNVATKVFNRASFDLIYARQFQDEAAWQEELSKSLDLGPTHLSLYQLTIEDGTAFGERFKMGKLPGLPSDDTGADLYELTQAMCDAAGLPAYEVSNHAKPGEESRHNQVYWHCGDYVGVGPGAHGRLTLNGFRRAYESERSPSVWLESVQRGKGQHETTEVLSKSEIASEYLMMSLRTGVGTSLARWAVSEESGANTRTMQSLVEQGFLWFDGERFGTTATGRPILNAVLRALLTG